MSDYDDEVYDDDEYYDDEDEIDDDESVDPSSRLSSSVNPFRSGGASGSSSSGGLPGRSPFSSSSFTRGSSGDSGSGSSGSSRFGSGSSSGGGSSGSGSSGSRFGSPSSSSSGSGSSGSRFGSPSSSSGSGSGSGSGSSGSRFSSGSSSGGSGSGSGSGSSGSRFGGGSSSGSSGGGSSGSSGSRFGGGSSSGGSGGSSSSSSSRFGSGSSSGSSGGGSSRYGSQSSSSSSGSAGKPANSGRDDKSKSSGGLRNRFGGGDKSKDDKSKSGGGGGIMGRFGGGDKSKSDQSKSGGGGIMGRFGGGDKSKSDQSRSAGGGSGIGAAAGGLMSRFKGGDDKSKSSGSRPTAQSTSGTSSAPGRSAFGGRFGGGQDRQQGRGKQDRPAKPQREKGSGGGIFSRMTSSLPFAGGGEKKQKTSKTRASKVPHRAEEGLTLDNKLDILGVGLLFGSLVLFFSTLSSNQGSLTGGINNFFSQLLGWGMLGVPIAMLAVGGWLIVRHFGDDAPEIDPVRVAGAVILYLGMLMSFQVFETWTNEIYASNIPPELYSEFVQTFTIDAGRGGGRVGAELHVLLVNGVGEIGAVFVILGVLTIGLMLATRTSAAELAVFVISIWRSFQISVQRRAQARRATQMAQLETANGRQRSNISVDRPLPGELPAGATAALPAGDEVEEEAPIPIEERSIPIRMGGRSLTPETRSEPEPVGQPAAAAFGAAAASAPAAAATGATTGGDDSGGRFGGIAARLRNAVPAIPIPIPALGSGSGDSDSNGKDDDKSDKDEKSGGGLFSRFTRSKDKDEAEAAKPAGATPQPTAASLSAAAAGSSTSTQERPAASAAPSPARPQTATGQPDRSASPFESPASRPAPAGASGSGSNGPTTFGRPGMPDRPAASSSPFSRPAASGQSPAAANPFRTPDKSAEDESGENELRPPQRPAAFGATAAASARPGPGLTRPAPFSPRTDDDDDDIEDDDEAVAPEDAISSRLSPAQPKGIGATPRPTAGSFASRFGQPAADDDDDMDDEDTDDEAVASSAAPTRPEVKGATGSLQDRLERLNAIRAGQTGAASGAASLRDDDDIDDDDYDDDEDYDDEDEEIEVPASATSRPRPFDSNRFRPPSSPPGAVTSVGGSRPAETPGQQRAPFNTPATPSGTGSAPAASQPAASTGAPFDGGSRVTQPQQPAQAEPRINTTRPTVPVQQPTSSTSGAHARKQWRLPDYRTLLSSGSEQEFDRELLVHKARVIEETLQSFGAPGRVVEINTGPVITQFGVEPDHLTVRGGKKTRVKVSAIAQLDKDLQLALGARSIRIEAPVPGKGYVGIEVPNDEASLVSLRDVMESRAFNKIGSPLRIALGQSVDGTPIAADLSVMPHLLIAGTTGSGKSVCVNSVITSLIINNTPDIVKFIMVDPKRVELTGYNGIPHLVAPVVVELERIVGVLKWVTREMDERYKRFSEAGARNIEDYNIHLTPEMERMPYIIVIIDELADLMMLAPDETERVITRIAALARATGIHLVIATQRPSVDVVTGLIKANFPARIAFAVAGGVDSRVILDQPGAERLLGRGDMLYMSGDSPAPLRLQGVFVSDMEINNITRYWRLQVPEDTPQAPITQLVMDQSGLPQSRQVVQRGERFMQSQPVQRAFWDKETSPASPDNHSAGYGMSSRETDADEQEDELYGEAVELVRRLNKASVSLLQRRLRIGYTRAARLIDLMEAQGIVGPPTEGSKPREVLPVKK